LGGDEFAILLNDMTHPNDAIRVADRIQRELALPIDLNGHRVFTTASIGIALSAIAYDQPADLLRNADVAMYRAKAQGRARHEVFDVSMYDYAIARWQLESDLHRAIERHEFRVYYQPFVSLTSGEMTGVEALLRWHHPKLGLVDPVEFIPLAEETGLIEPIGEWTLRTACAQANAWQTAGYSHLQVAVNVSPRQLAPPASIGKRPSLNEAVRAALTETGIPPQALGLEITDSATMPEGGFAILRELSALGIGISLDDFGLGSSLDCLKRFPLNTLKIDQSFVASMTSVPSDQVIITEIISMAHKLNLKVIAEGVETREQLDALRLKQCDEIQGNLFSEPLPAEALTKLLYEGRQLPL
jgi:EAL domain-containing protein (putative c-di-GMP-specific phosphodiesterase class I)